MTALQRFITASGMTNLADGIAVVAWGWIASLLTRDALLVALVPVALRLPWFLLALPAGLVTDRVDRRRLILAMDALRALAFLGAAFALWAALPLGVAPEKGVSAPVLYWSLLLAAFVVGGAEVFRDNAAQTMLPALVSKDRLERANGQLWSAELLTNALVGPALGAFLIGIWLPLAFGLNAAAYGLAMLMVAGLEGRVGRGDRLPARGAAVAGAGTDDGVLEPVPPDDRDRHGAARAGEPGTFGAGLWVDPRGRRGGRDRRKPCR